MTVNSVRRVDALTCEPSSSLYLFSQLFDKDYRSPLPQFGKSSSEMTRVFLLRSSDEDLLTYFREIPIEIYICSGATAIGVCEVNVAKLVEQWLHGGGCTPQALVESFEVKSLLATTVPAASAAAATAALGVRKEHSSEHPMVTTMGITIELDANNKGAAQAAPEPPQPQVEQIKYESSPMATLKSSLKKPASEQHISSPGTFQLSPIRSSAENDDKILEPSMALVELDYTMSESSCSTVSSSTSSSSSAGMPPRNAPSSIGTNPAPSLCPALLTQSTVRDTGPEYAKVYRICIELTALKGLLPSCVLQSLAVAGLEGRDALEQYLEASSTRETWLYACFEYPLLFGSAHIFSNPTPFVRRTNDGRTMTIVTKPELGGSTFSFDFAMSERNLSVALRECKLGVEIWRMAAAPLRTAESAALQRAPEDEFVGLAVVPLAAVVGHQARRQSLSEGQVAFQVHDYFAIHTESQQAATAEAKPFRKPCIGHVGVRLQLNDLGAFDTARTREQRLREEVCAASSWRC